MAREELTRLTGNGNGECGEDDCPNVYRTEGSARKRSPVRRKGGS